MNHSNRRHSRYSRRPDYIAIQQRLLQERNARRAEYLRRVRNGEDTTGLDSLNIDNDFDLSDNMAEGEIQDWEGGQP
jgi:hypothetical protein